jgi:hypothetical protein
MKKLACVLDGVPMTCSGLVLNPRWVKTLIGTTFLVLGACLILPCLIPSTVVLQNHYGSHYRKTAAHVMMLWKYEPLHQDDAL